MTDIYWLSDEDYAKAIGQWRLQVGEILSVFNMYGMGEDIKGAMGELEEVTIDLTRRIRGEKDHPIKLEKRRNTRR